MPCVLSCVTDSPTVVKVIRCAARGAAALDLPLRFLHAGSLDEEGRARLRASIAAETGGEAALDVESSERPVAETICRFAEHADARLIVIGARERERAVQDLIGSTARRVAQRARCSVLLVSTAGRDASAWARYVVSVTLDAASRELADVVLRIALAGAPAEVSFVRECSALGGSRSAAAPNEIEERADDEAWLPAERYLLTEFVTALDTTGVTVSATALPGRPGHEVARHAEDERADLLGVLAPRRRLGIVDRLLSHPTMVVLEKLPCSVLIFRALPGERR